MKYQHDLDINNSRVGRPYGVGLSAPDSSIRIPVNARVCRLPFDTMLSLLKIFCCKEGHPLGTPSRKAFTKGWRLTAKANRLSTEPLGYNVFFVLQFLYRREDFSICAYAEMQMWIHIAKHIIYIIIIIWNSKILYFNYVYWSFRM